LDNIEPMHPDEHIAQHSANGDFARWAKRPWIARAFGGKVLRGMGVLQVIPILTGMWSGRIRTGINGLYDMGGYLSPEDEQRIEEEFNRTVDPTWKRGDPPIT